MALRILPGIIGVFFLLQALNWFIQPADAAQALGMPLLDGIGRSTQMGDIPGVFLGVGGMCLLGAIRTAPEWLRPCAVLMAGIALLRTLAWLMHDADFAAAFIGVEVVCAVVLFLVSAKMDASAGAGAV